MIMKNNISLGIDISEDFISFALLKKSSKGIILTKAGRIETPPVCVSDGNIIDHAILGKTIKELLNKHRVKVSSASVSLLAKPTLSQIITLPEEMPTNVDNFIQGEIKNSSILAGKEYCYDYCLLSNKVRGPECKVLAQAASNEQIGLIVKAFNSFSMKLLAIELPGHAWVRGAYDEYISKNYDRNTVVLFSRSSQTHISVFRKGRLDYVRSLDFDCISISPDEFNAKIIHELKAVIQYYDIEVETEFGTNWQVLLNLGNCSCSADIFERLNDSLNYEVELCIDEKILSVLSGNKSKVSDNISAVAVGLALRKLRTISSKAMINLVPRDIERISSLKRTAMLIANLAAAVVVAILVLTDIRAAQAVEADKAISEKYQDCSAQNVGTLTERQRSICDSVKKTEEIRSTLTEYGLDDCDFKWSSIMDVVSGNIPEDMCVKKMMCSSNDSMSLHGDSLAYESPYLFTDMLTASDYIESAAVTETNNHPTDEKMITYRIDCKIRRNVRLDQDDD